jgi:hypothetical protein
VRSHLSLGSVPDHQLSSESCLGIALAHQFPARRSRSLKLNYFRGSTKIYGVLRRREGSRRSLFLEVNQSIDWRRVDRPPKVRSLEVVASDRQHRRITGKPEIMRGQKSPAGRLQVRSRLALIASVQRTLAQSSGASGLLKPERV